MSEETQVNPVRPYSLRCEKCNTVMHRISSYESFPPSGSAGGTAAFTNATGVISSADRWHTYKCPNPNCGHEATSMFIFDR